MNAGAEPEGRVQLGAGWAAVPIKYLVEYCRNGVWGDEPQGNGGDISCARVADFEREKLVVRTPLPTIRNVDESQRRSRMLAFGDLLLEKSGGGELTAVGAVVQYLSDEPAVCSNFIAAMRAKPAVDARWLCYMNAHLYSIGINQRSIKQTTGIQNLDSESYLAEVVPVPPKAVQARISAFLDRETAHIDALIRKKTRLIELLREKRTALITQAATRGLDPSVPMKHSGLEWLGQVPAHWDVLPINLVADKITNGFVGPTRDILVEAGVRYLQSLHIKRNSIKFDDDYFVTPEWSARQKKSVLRKGDVLIVQTGDLGQVACVTEEFVGCNCHALIIVSPNENKLSGRWLTWVLASDYGQASLLSIQTGAMHPHLNCGNVRSIQIPIPPVDEQIGLLQVIESQTARTEVVMHQTAKSIALLRERRSALVTAAVTGQIDLGEAV